MIKSTYTGTYLGRIAVLVVGGLLTVPAGMAVTPPKKPTAVPPPKPAAKPVTPPTRPTVPAKPGQPAVRPPTPGTKPLPGTKPEPSGKPGTIAHTGPGTRVIQGPHGPIQQTTGRNGHVIATSGRTPDGRDMVVHRSPTGVVERRSEKVDAYGHKDVRYSDGYRSYHEFEMTRRPGFRERTYFVDGHVYAHVYRNYNYGRFGYYPVYVPAYYYGPGYYGWFASPWAAPVPYAWGVYPAFGYYGAYFAPTPYYASPAAWMADYIIAENLKAAYAAQQAAPPDPNAPPEDASTPAPIPAQVRTEYVKQVQDQVQVQQAQVAGKPVADQAPGALNPKYRLFQSYSNIEADNNGQQCAIIGGDFVRREEDTPDANKTVAVTVVTVAKPSPSHCEANARVRVSVDTLQEWFNSFLESQQAGMESMAAIQGTSGIPPAPDATKVANPDGTAVPDSAATMKATTEEETTSAQSLTAAQSGGQ